MIQITRSGTIVSGSAKELERLRSKFEQEHCIRLSTLLEPGLLQFVQRQLGDAKFNQRIHKDIAAELCMTGNMILSLLYLLTNDLELFHVVQQITGCGRIGCFTGRVYRIRSDCGHYDLWHDDLIDDRIVGMSINLSTEIYSGGLFQIRDRDSQQILQEVANVGFGDGIIFKLAGSLQHRISDVQGTVPKTAFAGWFRSQPEFLSSLRNEPSESVRRDLKNAP
jgi:uncharacterized protein (DUF2164 family)